MELKPLEASSSPSVYPQWLIYRLLMGASSRVFVGLLR